METRKYGIFPASCLVAMAAMTSGCVQQPKPLYHWGSYQDQVYVYFKNEGGDYQSQVIALEADTQKARAADLSLPPGFHAHLGMLYAQLGKQDQVVQEFETEKTMYPEATTFMDFLIRTYTGQKVETK